MVAKELLPLLLRVRPATFDAHWKAMVSPALQVRVSTTRAFNHMLVVLDEYEEKPCAVTVPFLRIETAA
jgi:hypothetical protein